MECRVVGKRSTIPQYREMVEAAGVVVSVLPVQVGFSHSLLRRLPIGEKLNEIRMSILASQIDRYLTVIGCGVRVGSVLQQDAREVLVSKGRGVM